MTNHYFKNLTFFETFNIISLKFFSDKNAAHHVTGMSVVRFGSVSTGNQTVTIFIRFLKSKTKTKPNTIGLVSVCSYGFGL